MTLKSASRLRDLLKTYEKERTVDRLYTLSRALGSLPDAARYASSVVNVYEYTLIPTPQYCANSRRRKTTTTT